MRLRNWSVIAASVMAASLVVIGFFAFAEEPVRVAQKPRVQPKAESNAMVAPTNLKADPVVEAILATKPRTPTELLRAAKILANIEPELAKAFLAQLLQMQMDDAQWAALAKEFDPGVILRLAAQKNLLPEARQVAGRLLQAAEKEAKDPQHLASLAKKLAPDWPMRYDALVKLLQGGSAGAAALVAILADPQQVAVHDQVRTALAEFKTAAMGPLLAALDSSNPAVVAQAVKALALLKTPDARLLAAAQADKKDTAHLAQLLADRAREYAARRVPFTDVVDNQVEVWQWDDKSNRPAAETVAIDEASRRFAVRFARNAHQLLPNDQAFTALYLTTALETASPTGQAAEEAARADFDTLQLALAEAMRMQHWTAATALVPILASKGNAEKLLYQGSQPSLLIQATRQPDRRLRMAAAEAVVAMKPSRLFAGSSDVVNALTSLASSSGTRRVIVGGPKSEEALRFAGGLIEEGYAIDVATTGQEFLRMAFASPDYEFALIDVGIDQPTADVLVQRLHQDCRTAAMPVGLIARDGFLERAEHIASTAAQARAFPRPHDAAGIRWEAAQLRLLAPPPVPLEERKEQAKRALGHLATLTESVDLYDLRRIEKAALAAMDAAELVVPAVSVLGHIGTQESQLALVGLANRSNAPMEVRRAASRAFLENTGQFGILLTRTELLRQYDNYNRSEKQDAATQRILSSILDSLEARAGTGQDKVKADTTRP